MKAGKERGNAVCLAQQSREGRVQHTLGSYGRSILQALYPQDER